tara:strand:- start:50 stop:334 length:285 start_codon:yes stop_codon:yes gene_type:complete
MTLDEKTFMYLHSQMSDRDNLIEVPLSFLIEIRECAGRGAITYGPTKEAMLNHILNIVSERLTYVKMMEKHSNGPNRWDVDDHFYDVDSDGETL